MVAFKIAGTAGQVGFLKGICRSHGSFYSFFPTRELVMTASNINRKVQAMLTHVDAGILDRTTATVLGNPARCRSRRLAWSESPAITVGESRNSTIAKLRVQNPPRFHNTAAILKLAVIVAFKAIFSYGFAS